MTSLTENRRSPDPTRPARGLLVGRARKLWLTAHIATSVAWLGGAYCMLVLGTTALLAASPELQIACYELMHLFDRAVNIPLGFAALGTGLMVSLRTKWGLFRHRWVTVKFAATVATVVLAPILSVPRVLDMIDAVRAGHGGGSTPIEIVAISLTVVVTLTAVTGLSVFKPWGTTRRGTAGGRSDTSSRNRGHRTEIHSGPPVGPRDS